MNKTALLPILALAFASCAPTVQQSQPITRQATYAATCENVMGQLLRNAPALRPASSGTFSWSAYLPEGGYEPTAATASSVTLTSHSMATGDTILVRATCTEANGTATVSLTSTGQNEAFTKTSQEALFGLIKVP